jgi:F-type H+-transporting ATPase subunit b
VSIDWITVSAQIVNFLVLVWLLKRFLYQPVIRAMDKREQRIAERLEEAQHREQQAQAQQQQYLEKESELDQRREAILNQARDEADKQRRQLTDLAREEVSEKQKQWQQQAEQEKDAFLKTLRNKSSDAIQAICRKALRELANTELEEQVIDSFIHHLKSLDKISRDAMVQAVDKASEPMHIRTAFELDSSVRARITRAMHEHIAEGVDIDYGISERLLCGIELSAGGQRLSWSLAGYLDELGERVAVAFAPEHDA